MPKASKVRVGTGSSGCLMGVMGGFFAIFAAAGLLAAYALIWQPFSNVMAARGWKERVCEIVSSQVEESSGSEGPIYGVDIRYRYQVEWETYEGDRYDFSTGASSGYGSKKRIADAYAPGSEITCYVDPDDPTRSVINRGFGGYLWWGLLSIPFLVIGFGGLLFVLSSLWPRKSDEDVEADSGSLPSSDGPSSEAGGRRELVPELSPKTKVFGSLFLAVFWNGVVSFFVFLGLVPSFREGDPQWFLACFLVPFILIGLGFLAVFFYFALAWFNPRPRLTLEEGRLALGSETSLSWSFEGRWGRIHQLTIVLEGHEWARYRRGTGTATDRHVFYSEEVVDEPRFGSIDSGEANLRIPDGTMPSFESDNNGIAWQLKVRGDIPDWPDVVEDFDITIHPS